MKDDRLKNDDIHIFPLKTIKILSTIKTMVTRFRSYIIVRQKKGNSMDLLFSINLSFFSVVCDELVQVLPDTNYVNVRFSFKGHHQNVSYSIATLFHSLNKSLNFKMVFSKDKPKVRDYNFFYFVYTDPQQYTGLSWGLPIKDEC